MKEKISKMFSFLISFRFIGLFVAVMAIVYAFVGQTLTSFLLLHASFMCWILEELNGINRILRLSTLIKMREKAVIREEMKDEREENQGNHRKDKAVR